MKPEGGFGSGSFTPPSAPVTRAIVAVCVLVQLATTLGGAGVGEAFVAHGALIPARLTGVIASRPGDLPAIATLVSALFLHAGWVHLVVNLTFFLWVGRNVEMVAGRLRFIGLFLIAGIAGGLLEVAVAPRSIATIVGASGAIAGIFGAYAVIFARSQVGNRRLAGIVIPGALQTALWYAATWIGLQLLTAVAFNTGQGGIAIWTHIGGFIVGLVAGQPIARRLRSAEFP